MQIGRPGGAFGRSGSAFDSRQKDKSWIWRSRYEILALSGAGLRVVMFMRHDLANTEIGGYVKCVRNVYNNGTE